MEDSRIIELYWRRDPDAIPETAQKYGAYCFTVADNILHSAPDAEECVNDTWLHTWNAMPPQRPRRLRSFLAGLARNLAYLFDNNIWAISSEELTPMVRDNYTAVLLCDPEGGAPDTFYSVKGSLGGKLAVNGAGELAWDVESIVDTFFSPATSSFTIGGTCRVFRYTFDAAGAPASQEGTGEAVPYRR